MPSSLSPEKLKRIISKYVIDSLAWEDRKDSFGIFGPGRKDRRLDLLDVQAVFDHGLDEADVGDAHHVTQFKNAFDRLLIGRHEATGRHGLGDLFRLFACNKCP